MKMRGSAMLSLLSASIPVKQLSMKILCISDEIHPVFARVEFS